MRKKFILLAAVMMLVSCQDGKTSAGITGIISNKPSDEMTSVVSTESLHSSSDEKESSAEAESSFMSSDMYSSVISEPDVSSPEETSSLDSEPEVVSSSEMSAPVSSPEIIVSEPDISDPDYYVNSRPEDFEDDYTKVSEHSSGGYTLTYTLNSDGCAYIVSAINKTSSTADAIVIPKTHNGKDVWGVDASVSFERDSQGSIFVEEGIREVRLTTKNLSYIYIPDTAKRVILTIEEGWTSTIDHIYLPDRLDYYEINAAECPKLEYVHLPLYINDTTADCRCDFSKTAIEELVFTKNQPMVNGNYKECHSLKNVVFPEEEYEIYSIGEGLEYGFGGCDALTDLEFNQNLIRIRKSGCGLDIHLADFFLDCTALESVTFPASLQEIKCACFGGCTSLKSIVFEGGDPVIKTVLYGLTSLESVTLPSKLTSMPSFLGCTALKNIEIPDTVTEIPSSTFQNCSSLESIDIPSSVVSIGTRAFYNCTSLKSITIDNPDVELFADSFAFVPCDYDEDGYQYLIDGRCTGYDYSKLTEDVTSFTFSGKIKTMPRQFFSYQKYIKEIIIEDGVEVLDPELCYNVFALEKVVLPTSLTEVNMKFLLHISLYSVYSKYNEISDGCVVYYKGTESDWNAMNITAYDTSNLSNCQVATLAYYSESKPTDDTKSYWHYVDGEMTLWESEANC